MAENNGGKGTVSYPLAAVLTITGMIITGATTFYGVRDQALAMTRAEIQAAVIQSRIESREAFSHCVSREDWANWKESNRARTDQQYFEILTSIQRLGARLAK